MQTSAQCLPEKDLLRWLRHADSFKLWQHQHYSYSAKICTFKLRQRSNLGTIDIELTWATLLKVNKVKSPYNWVISPSTQPEVVK